MSSTRSEFQFALSQALVGALIVSGVGGLLLTALEIADLYILLIMMPVVLGYTVIIIVSMGEEDIVSDASAKEILGRLVTLKQRGALLAVRSLRPHRDRKLPMNLEGSSLRLGEMGEQLDRLLALKRQISVRRGASLREITAFSDERAERR